MKVVCRKPDAAVRQLDVAIGLLFTDGDPLAIRTLAGAAYGILADLSEHKVTGSSWRTQIIENSGLNRRYALEVLNSAQNYLKHADQDPEAGLEFEEEDNDHLLFVASIECGGIGHPLSPLLQVFQIWYLARYPEQIGHQTRPVKKSISIFPGLAQKSRKEQLTLGHQFLECVLTQGELLD